MSYKSKNVKAVAEIFSVQVNRTFLKLRAKNLETNNASDNPKKLICLSAVYRFCYLSQNSHLEKDFGIKHLVKVVRIRR